MLLLLAAPMTGQGDSIRTPSGKWITASTLDSVIQHAADEAAVPGLSIAIVNGDRMVYANTFGVINTDTQERVDGNTLFEGASLSKPLFAYFVLKLVDRGLLDLDEPLYKYLPHPGITEESQERYRKITARMVLSHSTGLPNHARGEPMDIEFEPGQGFSYSGEAYQYLAAVVAELSGVDLHKGLNDLFRELVTDSLAMPRTTFTGDDYTKQHKAYGHTPEGKPTERAVGDSFHAYSSVHSEAREFANFLIALLAERGLSPDTYADMLAEHTQLAEDNPLRQEVGQTGWGMGLTQKPSPYGIMHLHTGNNHDFQAYMMILPAADFGIVFFMNGPRAVPFIQRLNEAIGPII